MYIMQPIDDITFAGEEEEEWAKNGTVGDKEVGDIVSSGGEKSPPSKIKEEISDSNEAASGGYPSEDEKNHRDSPTNNSENRESPTLSEPKSPDLPKVRLNTNLATDPARNTPSAKSISPSESPNGSVRSLSESGNKVIIKNERIISPSPNVQPSNAELEYLASLPPALQSALAAGGRFFFPTGIDNRAKLDISDLRQSPVYTCLPCGIRFSSASTLEAHQTYYCSHRTQKSKDANESDPEEPASKASNSSSTGEDVSICDGNKSPRMGKAHRCPHCSYSADKKVSLNRHMRMHSTSPASVSQQMQNSNTLDITSEPEIPGRHLVDRYCQDCDIRFSSLKTFKAHKMHYCSTRHVIKTGKPPSAPVSPSESAISPGLPEPTPPPSQPFLALPTNPILIVPYSLFQNASILSGPVTMGLPSQDTACLLLPDGTLQPMAHGILSASGSSQNKQCLRVTTPNTSQPPIKEVNQSSEPPPNHNKSINNGNSHTASHHPPKPASIRNGGTPGPLDLTIQKSDDGETVGEDLCEDEKENRRSIDNHSVETEDIVCAPNIPLLLSTSTCSSPSPAPISPCSNSSQRRDGQSNSSSPRSGTSPPAKILRRPHNGVKIPKELDVKRRRLDSGSSLSQQGFPPGFDMQNLFLAAVAAQQDLKSDLPFPPELLPHLAASVSPRLKNSKLIPGLLPVPPNLQNLLPRTSSDLVNPASLLPMLNPELALRISSGEIPPVSQPQQIVVKQGVSKCQECNIVFCKLENYLAHKKHYCSARQSAEAIKEEAQPPAPQLAKPSPSPPSPATSVSPKPTTPHLQFICTPCGVKFMSYDSLAVHQTYYCTKKQSAPSSSTSQEGNEKLNSKSPKFKQEFQGVGWKCPCCNVVSTSTCAAQKHMEIHTNVKAFLCTICNYKGNTLRGMRTHIRVHFEKRTTDIVEDNFITCLIEDSPNNNIETTGESTQQSNTTINNINETNSTTLTTIIENTSNINGIMRNIRKRFKSEDTSITPINIEDIRKININEHKQNIKEDLQINSEDIKINSQIVRNHDGIQNINNEDIQNNTEIIRNSNEIKKENIDSEEYIEVDEDSNEINNKLNLTLNLSNNKKSDLIKYEINERIDTTTTTLTTTSTPTENDENSRYCTTCDITFNYASSLIAHKKFYCPNIEKI